jgi:hypothetical protein
MLRSTVEETPSAVAARFRAARRAGRPAWLWPEVSLSDWQVAQRAIAAVARDMLRGERSALAGDPDALGLACYTSGMGPLLGWWAEEGRVKASDGLAELLALHRRHGEVRTTRIEAAAIEIVDRLRSDDIPVVVLKGAHTARAYFPDPATRPAADVDLLIPVGDVDRAEKAFARAGLIRGTRRTWESSWRPAGARTLPRSLWFVHQDDPWTIDLHWSLNIRAGAIVAKLDDAAPFSSQVRWGACPEASVLDQPLLLLHLAAHAGAGLHNLTLLRLVELNFVIARDRARGALSWPAFLRLGIETGALGLAYPALRLAEKLMPGSVPRAVLDACAARTPTGVVRVVERLDPAIAQRIGRISLAEHFMWSRSLGERLGQIGSDLFPRAPWRERAAIYERRAWQILRGWRVGQPPGRPGARR